MIKRRSKQDILILTFLILILVVSNLNYLGFPILSNRFLTFALFPMVIMAGVGVKHFKTVIDKKKHLTKVFLYFHHLCLCIISYDRIFHAG